MDIAWLEKNSFLDRNQWKLCWERKRAIANNRDTARMDFDLTIPAQNPVDIGILEYAPFEGIAAKAALMPHAELLQDAA